MIALASRPCCCTCWIRGTSFSESAGIVGDALGTAIPLSFTCLWFLPRHLKKQIGVPVGTFLREAYTLPILLALPLVAVLWFANRFFYPRNLIQLTLEILTVSSIYGIGLLWAYRTNRAFHVAEIAGVTQPSGLSPFPVQQAESQQP